MQNNHARPSWQRQVRRVCWTRRPHHHLWIKVHSLRAFCFEETRDILVPFAKNNFLKLNTNSDNTLRVWDTESGQCLHILEGHSSRIWDVSSNDAGTTVASASGDSTVKIWDIKSSKASCRATLSGHSGDVYTVKYHPTSVRDFCDIRVRLNCT